MDIASLTIDQVRDGLRAREFSSVELTTEALRYAAAENSKTNAYLTFSEERARSGALRGRKAGAAKIRVRWRRASRGEGCDRHQGRAHDLRFEAAVALHSTV
jgi:Asp-tRNA(Asn)/Glu-tRNA(Gln) amidotransferase A subunit family amidase